MAGNLTISNKQGAVLVAPPAQASGNVAAQDAAQGVMQPRPPTSTTATVDGAKSLAPSPTNPVIVDWSQIQNKPPFGTAAVRDVPAAGNALPTQAVLGTDTRLNDARPPLAHTHVLADITNMSVFGRSWAQLADTSAALAALGIPGFANPLPIAQGGTGGGDLATAQANLAIPTTAAQLNALGALIKAGGDLTGTLGLAAPVNVASAATVNLSTATSNHVNLTGTTGVTALQGAAGRFYWLTLSGAVTFTNSASLALPRGANYVGAAGDVLFVQFTATNTAKVSVLNRQSGVVYRAGDQMGGPLEYAAEQQVASAATVDLSLTTSNLVEITGTTNISSFGTAAPDGTVRRLRFLNAAPGRLVAGVSAGSINPPNGNDLVVQQYDTVTVQKVGGVWWATQVVPGLASYQWVKIADWAPTAVGSVSFTLDPTKYKRFRCSIIGVRSTVAGNASDDLYMRVYQGGVLKSGASDYFNQMVYWPGNTGVILNGTSSVAFVTQGGMYTTPEEINAEVLLDAPLGIRQISALTQARWLSNSAARCLGFNGPEVLVQDAQLTGVLFGFANGGSYEAGLGAIVIEGLRR